MTSSADCPAAAGHTDTGQTAPEQVDTVPATTEAGNTGETAAEHADTDETATEHADTVIVTEVKLKAVVPLGK